MHLTRREWLLAAAALSACGRRRDPERAYAASIDTVKTNLWVASGDSITADNGVHVPVGNSYVARVATALRLANVSNIGVGSSTIDSAGQGATADGLYDSTKQVNIFSAMFGVNDISGGASAATYVANMKAMFLGRRAKGFKTVALTILSWASIEASREAANDLIRADPSWYDALADVGSLSTIMGAHGANADLTLYQADGHPTIYGQELIGNVVQPVIAALVSDIWSPKSTGQPTNASYASVVRI